MHLSCKCSWWTFLGTYSMYVLLQADSACKNVHKLVHDVVPQKRYVLQGTYLFGSFVTFKTVCPLSVFWSVWPSSVVQRTRSTCNLFVHCLYFVRTWNFTIACAIAFSDRVHDRTNDLFGWSRVRTPGLARDWFLWVQGSTPCPCSMIFSWVQGSIPWSWSPVSGPMYPWPMSALCHTHKKTASKIYCVKTCISNVSSGSHT